jgi:hypothetical protein
MFAVLTWRAAARAPHGLPIWMPFLRGNEATDAAARTAEALDLLEAHSPERFRRVLLSIRGFIVLGKNDNRGEWDVHDTAARFVDHAISTALLRYSPATTSQNGFPITPAGAGRE